MKEKDNKATKSMIPLSNETLKKALLSATIIASGFGFIGNANISYADVNTIDTEIVDKNQEENKVKKQEEKISGDDSNKVTPTPSGNAEGQEQDTRDNETRLSKDVASNPDKENTQDVESNSGKENIGPKADQVTNNSLGENKTTDEVKQVNTDKEAEKPINTLSKATTAEANQADGEGMDISEPLANPAVKAGESSDEPNYLADEKKIKDYSDSERYRSTQLEQGNGPVYSSDTSIESKDGVSFKNLEPSADSPDKTKYGLWIEIDKKKGQRTYTSVGFTNSGRLTNLIDEGSIPAKEKGEKLYEDVKEVNYKAEANIIIDGGKRQRNINVNTTKNDLEHINSIDNDNTIMAWEGKYKKDNPNGLKATEGSNASFTFTVNPWPNENDKLQIIKLNGQSEGKVFVKGQTVDTGVKVENLDDNARERLVGQVYNPINGKLIKGAKAYIDDDGKVKVDMPVGAVNEDGSINEDSDFYKDPELKGLTSLDVKFFARPRTAEEFKAISDKENYGYGFYTSTGAGTTEINHNGKNVTIDKQGIDRYDHYNLIGDFSLKLDDTRYYDQDFIDDNKKPTKDNINSNIKPGEEFKVGLYEPASPSQNQKTAEDMNKAKKAGEVSGKLNTQFLDKRNHEIAEKLGVDYNQFISEEKYKGKRWEVKTKEGDISNFTITAPESAKSGDFMAVTLDYTYTNGSIDQQKFFFVVQESTYIRPNYETQVNYPSKEQTSHAKVADDEKRIPPSRYTLPDTLEKDEAGNKLITDDNNNKWIVSIDEKSGEVSAKPVTPKDFNGGEKLQVPVIAHYVDESEPEKNITRETDAYFVIEEKANMTPRYNAKAGKAGDKLSSDVILNTEDKYNRRPTKFTLDSNLYTDDKGNIWNVTIDEKTGQVTAKVPEGVPDKQLDGALLNVPVTAHYFEDDGKVEAGTRKTEVQFIGSGTEGIHEYTEALPFDTTIEFDPDFYTNYPDEDKNYKIVTEGKNGEKKTKLTIKDSVVVKEEEVSRTKSTDAIIKVGQKDYTGTVKNTVTKEVPYTVKVVENPNLTAGVTNIKQQGKPGSKTYEYSGEIVNGKLKEGTNFIEKELTEMNQDPVEHIIEIGTKPVENSKDVESTVGVDVEWIFDDTKDLGTIKVSDLIPGKVTTRTKNKYNPATGQIETVQETDVEKGKRKVIVGMKSYTGEFKEEIKTDVPYKTEIVFDNTLKAGKKEITQVGINGEITQTVKRKLENGKVVGEEFSEEVITKKVQNQIIKVGSMTEGDHSYTEELPFETHVVVNPELKKGEWRYKFVDGKEQKGKLGSKTTEWNIVNSVVQNEPKITVEKPVDAIIEVGSGDYTGLVTHKESHEVPFDVEYKYSDELEAGQTKVEQKGEKGSYDVEFTQKITNGDKDGEPTITKTNEKAPKKEIIVIGTKPITKIVEKPYNTEFQYDKELEVGKVEEVIAGKDGKVTITSKYDKDSKEVVTSEVEEQAKNRVVRVGIKPVIQEEVIPNNTEYKYNPDLKVGQTKKVQDGTPGKVVVTTSYNKETGNLETTVERIEPVNTVYEYGTKSDGEIKVKSEIPYEIEIIEDDTMDAGTHKLVQEGEVGEKETTLVIENSKEKSRSEEITKEAKKKIIKIGTKPNDKMCPVPGEPETPDDPETPENPEIPNTPGKSEKPEIPNTPGKSEKPETPNIPEKAESHETPENSGMSEKPGKSENPEYPEKSGFDKSETSDKEESEKPSEKNPGKLVEKSLSREDNSDVLTMKSSRNPKTGIGSMNAILTTMGISMAGILATKKKKKEDE